MHSSSKPTIRHFECKTTTIKLIENQKASTQTQNTKPKHGFKVKTFVLARNFYFFFFLTASTSCRLEPSYYNNVIHSTSIDKQHCNFNFVFIIILFVSSSCLHQSNIKYCILTTRSTGSCIII